MTPSLAQPTGVWTALATPFISNGEVDYASLPQLLEHQLQGGIQGLVVCGTTGEAPTLSTAEKIKLLQSIADICAGQCQIMAGCGASSTTATQEAASTLLEAGASTLLVVTPPYNKPSIAGLSEHFRTVRSTVGSTPICLYHVPGRTAQCLSAEELQQICIAADIQCIKEASGNIELFSNTARLLPQCSILSGDDPTFLPSLSVGGSGVISVVSHLYPTAVHKLMEAHHSGNHALALQIHHGLTPIIQALFCEPNPVPLKFALQQKGLCGANVRLPLAPLEQKSQTRICTAIKATDKALSACIHTPL
ncbi:MAG: 4-hydroxy-tetrahydrodipicolinate synthase [Zetaproteobacteria bacterium]|nr:4-hydroxy-tetrahydrodipicolinate synthase [Zetaproteobacteria bacterium]